MSWNGRENDDYITLADAIYWIGSADNPMTSSILDDAGNLMLKGMVSDAVQAVSSAADENGRIVRSAAIAKINDALTDPPKDMHPRNISAWGNIKATMKESMWYPAPQEVTQ